MPKLEKVVATIGQAVYKFPATAGLYAGAIATATGIAIASADQADLPDYAVKELIQAGIVYRLTAVTLGNDGRRRQLKMLVAKDKLNTALDALKGKTYNIEGGNGGTIRSVGFARRVVSRG